jgi:predicted dehydrogenase
MAGKMKFGIVGAGAIAQSYAQAFEGSETATLVAVADVREEAARAMAHSFACPSYTKYEDMLTGTKLDAVVICTPPNTHKDIATFFLENKVHVLCEKPLTLDVKSATQMLEVAKLTGMKLSMGSKFRYVEDVIKAKSILASGILGDIILFENAFTARVEMKNRWNADPKISGGGVLIDNGAHSVDLMRYFMGPVAAVHVVEGKRVQGLPVEDTVHVFVKSVSGIMGSIDLSWSINKELDHFIKVHGSQGSIVIGWKESKYRQSSSRDWVVFGKGYNKVQAFRSQIDNFSKTIQGQDMLLITAKDAIASVEVIEAAYRSLRQDSWVSVNGAAETMSKAVA